MYTVNPGDTSFDPCVGLQTPCVCTNVVSGCPDSFGFQAVKNAQVTSGVGSFQVYTASQVSLSGITINGVNSTQVTPLGSAVAASSGLPLSQFTVTSNDGDVYPIGLIVTMVLSSSAGSGLALSQTPSGVTVFQCSGGAFNLFLHTRGGIVKN